MSVSIRLTRQGAKKKPFYRIVAIDRRKRRDGDYLERLGYYDPNYEPPQIVVDIEKVNQWIAKGARCSNTVASLIKKVKKQPPKEEK